MATTRWFVGAQNDALYVIDSPPALSNDYPNHEAPRECIAKVYGDAETARLIAAAPELVTATEALLGNTECPTESYEGKPCGRCNHCEYSALLARIRGEQS